MIDEEIRVECSITTTGTTNKEHKLICDDMLLTIKEVGSRTRDYIYMKRDIDLAEQKKWREFEFYCRHGHFEAD